MFAIDGLVSGLDTTSIIEGLLSIQQSQIDRLNFRKQEIVTKQSAFKGIEANAVTLKNAAAQLASFTNDVFSVFSATSSDDSIIEAAADRHASEGEFLVQLGCSFGVAVVALTTLAESERHCPRGFFGPVELANGYVELTDAVEQAKRLGRDIERRQRRKRPARPLDETLLAALQAGLPPCAGVALGLERLQMIHDGTDDMRNVVTFAFEPGT